MTQAYSPLKSTSSRTVSNRQKRSWILQISLASVPTRSWILLGSQVFVGLSYFTLWPRMSFGTVVNRSQVILENFLSRANFCRVTRVTRGGRAQVGLLSVAKHHRSVGCRSQVYHDGRAVIVVLGPEFMSIDLRMACEGCQLASLSWCGRKSLLLHGQWYTFCLLVCQSLPDIAVNASLRSDDKNLTTAHESKKSRIFQLVNRS